MDTPVDTSPTPRLTELTERLSGLMLGDQRRLRRRIYAARKARSRDAQQAMTRQIQTAIDQAEARIAQRRTTVPRIQYPANLPVSQQKEEILTAIREHQVVIVAGETGSGKTTQLPKLCLELGRGIHGLIGHTQPRRLAARTVAERIAEELETSLGDTVGYQVRFTEQVSQNTLVKLMTDGILLAELQSDRSLSQYDTLIIDEAHERSLNIDFILGHLKQLLPRRPDLKVIITSATIDPERFSQHFDQAPIIEVSGRTYPVELRYRPINDPDAPESDSDRDLSQAITDAVDELSAEGPGDVLVFLSGEREIREASEALRRMPWPNTEILPLYARLSIADQHRVFAAHTGRRIVLATNVAETSLTVPGIKYVIDAGTARISRYSRRLKVQRLPIEPISQASARQRAGRCGRTSDGICIRLYSEVDFVSRPAFTEPEILRTSLASVILQMTATKLGEVQAFPFIDMPDRRDIKAGIQLLEELGALSPLSVLSPPGRDAQRQLTALGRTLAQLPIDPRLARMVVEADRNGCVREVLIIVAALSIPEPRERPAGHEQAADDKHRRYADGHSDFLSYLNLWRHVSEQQHARSTSQFRKWCKNNYVNYLRLREWQDLHRQLQQLTKNLGITANSNSNSNSNEADPQRIHTSLLAGLLSHIGLKDPEKQEYQGARGARFAIFPGSALAKAAGRSGAKPGSTKPPTDQDSKSERGKLPRWVMAAELVETSRLWGRIAARIEPEWIEPLAGHLIKRNYSEPHWEAKRGAAVAYEKVTLYGLPVVPRRAINYGQVDPETARDLFIRHALVQGEWRTHHQFFHDNRALLEELAELEDKARRRDIVIDDQTLFDFYDQRLPAEAVSSRHFDSWWKKTRQTQPELLNFSAELLAQPAASTVDEGDYPDSWQQGALTFALTYQFEPGTEADGVTVHIPLSVLNQVVGDDFEWQIPGLREELVIALLRSLDKPIRRQLVPVPDRARALLPRLTPHVSPLLPSLAQEIRHQTGTVVPLDAWRLNNIPDHLRVTFSVEDEHGNVLAAGKELGDLKQRLTEQTRSVLSTAAHELERTGLRSWEFDEIPHVFATESGGENVKAFPALADEGTSVALRMFETEDEQQQAMWSGTRRLLQLAVPAPTKLVQRQLSNYAKLVLSHSPHGSMERLLDDCTTCAIDGIVAENGGPAWDEAGFTRLTTATRERITDHTLKIVSYVEAILRAAHQAEAGLGELTHPLLAPTVADMRRQLSTLVYHGFVTDTGLTQLPHVARYTRGIQLRMEKVRDNPQRDHRLMAEIGQLEADYQELLDELPGGRDGLKARSMQAKQIWWMLQELRVSYFAQALGTAHSISEKRILRAMDDLANS